MLNENEHVSIPASKRGRPLTKHHALYLNGDTKAKLGESGPHGVPAGKRSASQISKPDGGSTEIRSPHKR